MNGSRWERLADAFEAAASQEPGNRRAMLDAMLGATGATRREVASMLEASESERSWSIERKLLDAAAAVAESTVKASLTSGLRVGSWSIEGLEGAGGMGEVYRATRIDGAFEQRVAIKVMRRASDALADERTRRFEGERRILARLEHPGIVGIIDGGWLADGRPYFVMPFVEGSSLLAHCDEASLPTYDRLALLARVARATGYAHERGVVHRDLKPSNILVGSDGRPHLLDFGIAKLDDDLSAVETGTGAMLLTPAYAAPEQLRGGSVTPATDVYALGMLLRELMAPCDAASRVVMSEFRRIERRALEFDPARRYADANAMAAELERLLRRYPAGRVWSESEHDSVRRRWARRLAMFGAAATASIVGVTMSASRIASGDADELPSGADAPEPARSSKSAGASASAPAVPVPAVLTPVAPPAPARSTTRTPAPSSPVAASVTASPSAAPDSATPHPKPTVSLGGATARTGVKGSNPPSAPSAVELRKLAVMYGARHLTAPAVALMDSVVDRVTAQEGAASIGVAYARAQRAVLQLQGGALDAAERDLAFADSVFRHAIPLPDTLVADADLFSGVLALWRNRPDSALARFEASYAVRARWRGPSQKRAAAACGIGLSLSSLGREQDAAHWLNPSCSMQHRWPRGFYRPAVELMQEGVRRARGTP